MAAPLPNRKALWRLGVKGRIELLEPLADQLRAEIVRLKQAGAHWRQVDNVKRRLRRVYEAADRFGHYVGQPSNGHVSSPANMRIIVRALAKYAVRDPGHDPDPDAGFEVKPRIRVKAISIHVPPAVSL